MESGDQAQKKIHIVLIRFSSLGDLILTTSLLSAIAQRWGESCYLTFFTSKAMVPLLEGHPFLDQVIGHERQRGAKDLIQLKKEFLELHRTRPVSFILDLHGTLRSLFFTYLFLENPHPCGG